MARASPLIPRALLLLTLTTVGPSFEAASAPHTDIRDLERQISGHGAGDFSSLIETWKKSGSSAKLTRLLLQLAQKQSLRDKSRAIALVGAAELANDSTEMKKAADLASKQLADRRWLVRFYAIKALEKCGPAGKADLLSLRLLDPSLMVRAEAAEALYRLALQNPREGTPLARDRLLRTLESSSNYSGNRPLWVPERALAALGEFRARSELEALEKRFEDEKKPELVQHARRALQRARTAAVR